jgi:hypothetical protein
VKLHTLKILSLAGVEMRSWKVSKIMCMNKIDLIPEVLIEV